MELGQELPVVDPVDVPVVHQLGRLERPHDVEKRRFLDPVWMVQCEPVADTGSAVVPREPVLVEPEQIHGCHHVLAHARLEYCSVSGAGGPVLSPYPT